MLRQKMSQWSCQVLAFACILVCMSFAFINVDVVENTIEKNEATPASAISEKMELYDNLELASMGLSREAFTKALTGYTHLLNEGRIRKDNILSIIDMSLPSGKKRLFVIDLSTGELVFNTYAAHGRNSGTSIATQFSNQPNSFKTSLGFYITGKTYNGKHGCSLRLEGEEAGINDNALSRGIVMHSASYVGESIVAQQGYIGRSQGCPALPDNIYKQVIEKIKDGSCLFLYSPDKTYAANSKILKERMQG